MNQPLGIRFARRGQLILLLVIVVFMLLLIVNNGNILTDGTTERKYLQRS